ncbi:MAG: SCP2 sterol-binding domain-containing protein [Nitrososphaeria archaeon]|jgi:Putative sterol carrier protein
MSSSFEFLKEISAKINKDDIKKKALLQFSGKAFQFKLNEGESFYVKFENDGSMSVEKGEINSPAASVSVSDSLLIDLINGKADPVKSFFIGKLKVSGDLMLAQKLVSEVKKLL